MYCSKCGALLNDTDIFCSVCGTKIEGEIVEQSVNQQSTPVANVDEAVPFTAPVGIGTENQVPYPSPVVPTVQTKKKFPFAVVIPIVIFLAVAVVAAIFITNSVGKNSLHDELMRDWSRTEVDNDSYFTLELDFSEDECEYKFESYFFDETLSTFDYEIVSPDTVIFYYDGNHSNGKEVTIEFDDEKEMMTMTPAITSTDSCEYWYNFD